jgi:Ca2+/Na+ antiporter
MKEKNAKLGIIFGSIGATIGGLLWIIIAGIAIKSILFIVVPAILIVIFISATIVLYNRYPALWLIIIGMLILCLTAVNFIFLNLVFTQIPDSLRDIDTGKNQYALIQSNIFLGIFSFSGLFCLIFGIFKKRLHK